MDLTYMNKYNNNIDKNDRNDPMEGVIYEGQDSIDDPMEGVIQDGQAEFKMKRKHKFFFFFFFKNSNWQDLPVQDLQDTVNNRLGGG